MTSRSLLSTVLDNHPPSAIITEAGFLPHLLELIYDTNEESHHPVIVVREPDIKFAQKLGKVRIIKFSDLEHEGAKLEPIVATAAGACTKYSLTRFTP